MNLKKLLESKELNGSVIFGYYGGGNFGDELLLAVLTELLKKYEHNNISFYYSNEAFYKLLHTSSFGKPIFKKAGLLKGVIKSRNLVFGGGGHWGLDMNKSVFLVTVLFFMSHFLLGKKVFLLGVGYYDSTTRLGHISAYLAAKASSVILARDEESYANFSRFGKHVFLDQDIAEYIDLLDLDSFEPEAEALAGDLFTDDTSTHIIVSPRRFSAKHQNNFNKMLQTFLASAKKFKLILITMEPKIVDPEGFLSLSKVHVSHKSSKIIDFSFSPLIYVKFLRLYQSRLKLIAPQYHAQLVAFANNIPVLPIAYDNKVKMLLKRQKVSDIIDINNLDPRVMYTFANEK